ncbi:hypothetical protein [Streptomyces sp. NPDC005209]|uniref:hypothetical protein n=1 Tax=Streptomyces sp. NPDC005209 TaxID=3156715 RepID=UPI0033A32A0B
MISRADPWAPVWQLNKPSTWTLTLSTASGTLVRTLTGTSTWKLTARPRNAEGPGLTLSCPMTLG